MATVIVREDEDLSKAIKRFQRVSAPIRREVRMHEFYRSKKERRTIKLAKSRRRR